MATPIPVSVPVSVPVKLKQAPGIPLINRQRSRTKQKRPRSQWISYVTGFMSHRNLMVGIWNSLAKKNQAWDTAGKMTDSIASAEPSIVLTI